jgi:hypothetical protein
MRPLLLPLLAALPCFSQTIGSIKSAGPAKDVDKGNWTLQVHFAGGTLSADTTFLVFTEKGDMLETDCGKKLLDCAPNPQDLRIPMKRAAAVPEKLTFALFRVKDSDGKETTVQKTVDFGDPGPVPPKTTGDVKREKATLWVKGDGFRVSGTEAKKPHDQFYVNADIKVDYPVVVFNKNYFAATFDLKASTVPEADPNTLSIGMKYEMPNILPNLQWSNAPKFEASKDFAVSDFLHASTLTYIVPRFPLVDLNVQGGVEAGRNVDNILWEAKGNGIARLMTGGTVFHKWKKVLGMDKVVFTGSYVRRWPLTREVTVQKDPDDDKKNIAVAFGNGPKQHAEANLEFTYDKGFGFFVGYEYGQLPPAYQLADHRGKVGFLYKFGPK